MTELDLGTIIICTAMLGLYSTCVLSKTRMTFCCQFVNYSLSILMRVGDRNVSQLNHNTTLCVFSIQDASRKPAAGVRSAVAIRESSRKLVQQVNHFAWKSLSLVAYGVHCINSIYCAYRVYRVYGMYGVYSINRVYSVYCVYCNTAHTAYTACTAHAA